MINLKVKTLDSQNHDFSVDDDITVRQFKQQIAEKINVAVDVQRLIYCGRVLSDDKALKEYDVNGKVVHLVQRAPPSARGNSANNAEEAARSNRRSRSSDNNVRGAQMFRGFEDLNGMFVGQINSIPMNVNATTPPQIPSVSPSSTLCMNRITVARHMLECADNIINYLENPDRGLNNAAMDILSQQTMESTVFEVGISAVGDVDIPHNQMQNFVQAFQGAVSAAFRQNGISNVTVQQPDSLTPSVQVFGTMPDTGVTPPNTSCTATPLQESSGPSSATSSSSSSTSESSTDSRRQAARAGSRQQTTSTQTLAEVVQQMRGVQTRMEPFIQQYYDILQNDPQYDDTNVPARESSQRVYDRVSEALHYMSHAQHAISDLMLDLQTSSPRHLCCRPILVEQSAFVSSGIAAVPHNINIANLLRATTNNNNNNNNAEVGNNNINASIINLIPPPLTALPGGVAVAVPSGAAARSQSQTRNQQPTAAGNGRVMDVDNIAAAAVAAAEAVSAAAAQQGQSDSYSSNDDVVTRVYIPLYNRPQIRRVQDSIRSMLSDINNDDGNSNEGQGTNPPSSTDGNQTSQANNPTNNSTQMQVARLIQAVVNAAPIRTDIHVQINAGDNASPNGNGGPQANPTNTNNTTTTTNNGGESNGQQPRFATVTLPTTSTQTRSTSRPHVHSIPQGHIRNMRPIPTNMLTSFDRFLPCNSHHIRENNGADRTPSEGTAVVAPERSNTSTVPPNVSVPNNAASLDPLHSLPFNLFGSQFTLSDFEQIVPSPNTLNRIRDTLHAYIVESMFDGQTITDTNMTEAINVLIQRLEPVLGLVSGYEFADYDARASLESLIRNSLPFCINLIRDDGSHQFGVRLLRFLLQFVRRFFMILLTCIGATNAQTFSGEFLNMALLFNTQEPNVNPGLVQLFLPAVQRQLERSSRQDQQEIQNFLVIRRPAPENNQATSSNHESSPMDVDDAESSPELATNIAEISILIDNLPEIEIDDSSIEITEDTVSISIQNMEPPIPPPLSATNAEALPSVVVGSEPWHTHFPSNWLPVITRDIGRQRRQNTQGPYSDAYISGMSTKRRRLVARKKPPTDVPSLLSDGVRRAVKSSGIHFNSSNNSSSSNNVTTIDELAANISNDTAVQSSYCEAMKANIRERLQNDPEYDVERYPNCSKYFDK